MEFTEVVRRRRMVRRYDDRPVEPALIDRMLANAVHAPSAGFTQGWSFLVLDTPDQLRTYWEVTAADRLSSPDTWLQGMLTAPVLIVPLSSEPAYRARYSEPDKQRGASATQSFPVPYWHLDTAMATLLMLLTAVDEGLGACFFGLPGNRTQAFREAFGVPDEWFPIGALSVGHRIPDHGPPGSARRGRKATDELVHRGRWGSARKDSEEDLRAYPRVT